MDWLKENIVLASVIAACTPLMLWVLNRRAKVEDDKDAELKELRENAHVLMLRADQFQLDIKALVLKAQQLDEARMLYEAKYQIEKENYAALKVKHDALQQLIKLEDR